MEEASIKALEPDHRGRKAGSPLAGGSAEDEVTRVRRELLKAKKDKIRLEVEIKEMNRELSVARRVMAFYVQKSGKKI